MHFNRRHRCIPLFSLTILVALGMGLLPGCDANLPDQDEVFPDAAQRVENTLLPPLVDESEAVLRNLVNLLTALPEICATPLASLGAFTSSLPALGKPVVTTFNDSDGTWDLTWRAGWGGSARWPVFSRCERPRNRVKRMRRAITSLSPGTA